MTMRAMGSEYLLCVDCLSLLFNRIPTTFEKPRGGLQEFFGVSHSFSVINVALVAESSSNLRLSSSSKSNKLWSHKQKYLVV